MRQSSVRSHEPDLHVLTRVLSRDRDDVEVERVALYQTDEEGSGLPVKEDGVMPHEVFADHTAGTDVDGVAMRVADGHCRRKARHDVVIARNARGVLSTPVTLAP